MCIRRVIFYSISNTKLYKNKIPSREINFYNADDKSDFEINLLINIIVKMDSLHDPRDIYMIRNLLKNHRQKLWDVLWYSSQKFQNKR